jgi:hypothetical protein
VIIYILARTSTRYAYSIVVHHDANLIGVPSCVLFSIHVEMATGVFGKLVARCLAVLAFLRATDVLLACLFTRVVSSLSAVTLANTEGSLQTSTKKGEASMDSSVVTHLVRWSCCLSRVLSYKVHGGVS